MTCADSQPFVYVCMRSLVLCTRGDVACGKNHGLMSHGWLALLSSLQPTNFCAPENHVLPGSAWQQVHCG